MFSLRSNDRDDASRNRGSMARTSIVLVLVLMMVLPYLGTAKGRGRGSKWW